MYALTYSRYFLHNCCCADLTHPCFSLFRLSALEKSHFERKEVFSIINRCQVWTKRAEEHMASVRPATAEAAKIITQLDAHKAGIKHNSQHLLICH